MILKALEYFKIALVSLPDMQLTCTCGDIRYGRLVIVARAVIAFMFMDWTILEMYCCCVHRINYYRLRCVVPLPSCFL